MDIIRAWKDEEYRLSLSEEQLSLLPENPAGLMELSDDDLESIVGGGGNNHAPPPPTNHISCPTWPNSLCGTFSHLSLC